MKVGYEGLGSLEGYTGCVEETDRTTFDHFAFVVHEDQV
jgi:hypothetical protein